MSSSPALHIRFIGDDPADLRVDYRSASKVSRLLVGKSADEVPALLGALFAICPSAQKLAGSLAIASARGEEPDNDELLHAQRAAKLEIIREHGLRILLGWAGALAEQPDRAAAAQVNAMTRGGASGALSRLVDDRIFAGSLQEWLAINDMTALTDWAGEGRCIAARFIANGLVRQDVPDSLNQPKSTLVARHLGHPLLKAFEPGRVVSFHVARLIDLAKLTTEMADDGGKSFVAQKTNKGSGHGSASVFCSRGQLTHRLHLADDKVRDYEILSPTDTAFAMNGFGRQWLQQIGLVQHDKRDDAALAVVQALDPCVEYRIEVR